MQLLTFNILTTSVLAFPQAALNSEHLRVIRDVQPEGESAPEPEAEMGILSPVASDQDLDGPWFRKYEQTVGNYQPEDHIVSVAKNVSQDHFNRLVDVIQERQIKQMTRGFGDFVKMSFWQAVLSQTDEGHTFNDIHEVSLDDSTNWWRDNFVNHGCYCWPEQEARLANETNPNRVVDSQRISGFGQPRDPIDEQCFDLYSCYRCVSLMPECQNTDWVNSHYDCQFVVNEKVAGTNQTRLAINCNDPDPCMQSLCECDKNFAMNAAGALQFKDPANAKVFPDKCERKGHEDSTKKCCGAWPFVRPFPTNEKCCSEGNIFNISEGECSAEEINSTPGFDELYEYSHLTLNRDNPAIMNHDHNASHENSDHIHPVIM